MADLTEDVVWVEGLYRIEEDDPVQGGESGIDNINAKRLGSRTRYLRLRVNKISDEAGNIALGADGAAKVVEMVDAAAANVAPARLTFRGASAHASSTSNKAGEGFDFVPGAGTVPGSDHGGAFRVSLPRAVATVTKALEIWRTSDANQEFGAAGHKLLAVDYSGGYTRLQLQDGDISGVALVQGTYTHILSAAYMTLTASGGAVHVRSSLGEFARTRADGTVRVADRIAVDTLTTNATPVLLVSLSPPSTRPATVYAITVAATDVAGNKKVWRDLLVVGSRSGSAIWVSGAPPSPTVLAAEAPMSAPAVSYDVNGAAVRVWGVGFGTTASACQMDIANDRCLATAHGYALHTPVVFATSGVLPPEVTAGVTYFVVEIVDADSFRFSATRGGAHINMSVAGGTGHTHKRDDRLTWSASAEEVS